jgi:S1-C subfamily serine protease
MAGIKRFLIGILTTLAVVCLPTSLNADVENWEKILGPVLRVQITGGSATIIHKSEKGMYALSNHHVISAFTYSLYKSDTPAIGDNIFFNYYRYSEGRVVGRQVVNLTVVLVNKQADLVLLKVVSSHEKYIKYVAKLATLHDWKKLRPLDDVIAVGCPARFSPVPTVGSIMRLGSETNSIGQIYNMIINAPLANGNSGGAVYRHGKYYGVPSAISLLRMSKDSIDSAGDKHRHIIEHPVSHLGFVIGLPTIYTWLATSDYYYIVPGVGS